MCGIVVTNTGTPLDAVCYAVAHRGTHPPAHLQRGRFLLVHALMPVQGATPVSQPYTTSADAPVLCFQGELYTHPGYDSDTHFLHAALTATPGGPPTERAAAMRHTVNGLDGMFAFVFDDGACLWFAVDVFGEQPLYYYHEPPGIMPGRLTVASEKKQMRACGVPLRCIEPCRPGVLYRYDHGTQQLSGTVYHAFDYDRPRVPLADPAHIRQLVAGSCRRKFEAVRLQRPALLLSGGIDSSIMAYELGRLGLQQAFTVAIDTDSTDFKTAEVAAARHGLRLTKVLATTLDTDLSIAVTESSNRSIVEEYVCHIALAKCLAEQNYRVVFTGSGADELFCGYSYYLRFASRKDPASMVAMQRRLVEEYHDREIRSLNKVYMSKAIEVRSPFLDRGLCDYATTLDVAECLVAGGRMKAALRDAYAGCIDTPDREKVIAGRSMGVTAHFEAVHGGDGRAYHARHKEVFSDPQLPANMVSGLGGVQYSIIG